MSKSVEMKRGGFIGMIATVFAVPSLADTGTPIKRNLHPLRALVMCDINRIPFDEIRNLGESLGRLGLEGPIVGVELNFEGDPIRILNIDHIPRETVNSLVEKIREIVNG